MSTEAIRVPSPSNLSTTVPRPWPEEHPAQAGSEKRRERTREHPPVCWPGIIHAAVTQCDVFYSVEVATNHWQAFPLLMNRWWRSSAQLEVLIPDDAQLNTRFVFEFEILGVVDDEGLPQEMKVQALVIIDQQRMIESTASLMDEGPAAHGTSAPVQVNLSSMSLNERHGRVPRR